MVGVKLISIMICETSQAFKIKTTGPPGKEHRRLELS
jgi:hypothetical protein